MWRRHRWRKTWTGSFHNSVFTVKNESDRVVSYLITDKDKDLRIDAFLASQINDLTRSRIQELIKKGFAKVNDLSPKISYRLKMGDRVGLFIPPPLSFPLEPEPVKFGIIHEDPSLIVLSKPPGLVIHPAPGHLTGTLAHGLLQYCRHLSGREGILRPGIVHRLDKDTSGLMVVAKNDRAHAFLAREFKGGRIKKRYLALVHGIMRGAEGEIDRPIARHPKRRKQMSVQPSKGKRAVTLWHKMEEFSNDFSLLSVTTKTGRTHQIRVHLSYMGHPIIGDPVYGYRRNWWKRHFPLKNNILSQIKRQMLHAETLGFIHPDSEIYCEFKAPVPNDMDHLLNTLKLIDLKNNVTVFC